MIMNEEISRNPLYKEVLAMAQKQKIDIEFSVMKETALSELGLTGYEPKQKAIQIEISSSELSNESVYIHELLHAKSYLLGYPYIQRYSLVDFHPYIDKIIASINNSFHHYIMVYPEMKRLGYDQNIIDKQFIDGTIEDCNKKFEGSEKLAHVVNLLELYLRSPESIEKIERKIRENQSDEFELFNNIRKIIVQVRNPLQMRKAYAEVFKALSEFIYSLKKENLYLNMLISVSPIFRKTFYNRPACNSLYAQKLVGYPHVFVLDKDNNQCCYFLSNNGKDLSKDYVEDILKKYTLGEFMEIMSR